tara:strand:+ start:2998 stop:5793 length:2796 start_codon:yes stop_codon:yes gene_type:complete
MKNKLLFLFLIVLFFFEAKANEEFTFDVTKIEISENGNRIIGTNRGLIKSNTGIDIEADNFEYNQTNNILKLKGNIIINYPNKNIKIYGNEISYLKHKNIINAKEGIKIIDQNKKIITSDNLFYDLGNNIFTVTDNVNITDDINYYKISSDKINYLKNKEIIESLGSSKVLFENNYSFKSDKKLIIDNLEKTIHATRNVEFIDLGKNYKIFSQDIKYFENDEKIITKGKTDAYFDNNYELNSRDIIYLGKPKIVSSKNKSSINDKINKAYYQISNFNFSLTEDILKGENILVNTDYNKPFNDNFFIKSGIFNLKQKSFSTQDIEINLKKNTFNNNKNDPRLKGISSSSKNGITVINKAVFTSCSLENKDCPPWSLQAEKIQYDQNKKVITYDNALLKVYNKPIFYFPKFFHPGPSVKRQSGFLAPRVGNSKILGTSIQIPYYIAPAENKDFTFTPSVYSKDIIRLQNEFRLKSKNSSFIADLSFTDGYKSKTNNDKNSITHLFSKFSSNLELDNFTESNLDLSIQKVNNDTYLKIFDQDATNNKIKPESSDTLKSELKLNLRNDKYSLVTGMISYEDLKKKHSDRYEFVLPYYNLSGELSDGEKYGFLGFSSKGDNILKDTNNLRSRIINDFDFRGYDYISKNGIQNNLNLYVKNLIISAKNDNEYDSNLNADLQGIFELKSTIPMIKVSENFTNYLEPKISLRYNPSNMANHKNTERRINNSNLFDINRLGLEDTLESGANVTIGLDFKKENLENINKYFEMKVGTVIRDDDNTNIPLSSGINNKNSNIFGSLSNKLNENISINYDFSANNNFNKIEYNSLGLLFTKDKFKTEFNFIEENGDIGDSSIIENITSFKFDENNQISFKTRENRRLDITEYYNLIYEYKNDCLVAGLTYNKTYYEDRDLVPTEDFMFKLTLIPITTVGQSISN